ncbi:MAG TPA: phosphate/phosphite/phosphonate ABC transporter substrate-binding protein [Candidatus Binatia bacterium]
MFLRRHPSRLGIACTILLFDLILGSGALAQTPRGQDAKTITLGIIADTNQKKVEANFQDFVRYVGRNLSASSGIQGKVMIAPTQSRLASLLTERRADFYMESPYPTYLINDVYGAGKLLLRRWKGGMADYHSLIFTRTDGETKRLEDLKGKIIAFEDPQSTSGYFLPKLFLTRKGFTLSRMGQIDAKVRPGEIGYVFATSQRKLFDLVLTKKVAAGAFSNDDYAALEESKKPAITILAETASLPRHLVSVRKGLPPALVNGLEKVLLSMHRDSEGRSIMQKAAGTTKFDALPGGESAISRRLLEIYYSPEKK